MPDDGFLRVFGLAVLVIVMGVIGVGVILALISSWRNQARRDKLLDEGRALRASQHPQPKSVADSDVWSEAGRRYHDAPDDKPGNAQNADVEPDGDDDDPPRT